MDFNLLADAEARSPALSLSDSGTPQHEHSCKGQDHSGECKAQDTRKTLTRPCGWIWVASGLQELAAVLPEGQFPIVLGACKMR